MSLDSVLPMGAITEEAAPETVDETVFDDSFDDTDDSLRETENDDSQESPQSTFDWDSEENPYKSRFAGMQGTAQQAIERAREAEARRIEVENMLFEREIAELNPVEQQAAWQQLQMARQGEYIQHEMSQRESMMNDLAKTFLIQQLSTTYGVQAQQLARFNDPESMVAFAEAMKEQRKTTRKQSRKSTQADRFEGGGASAPPPKKQYNGDLDAAAMDFAALKLPLR